MLSSLSGALPQLYPNGQPVKTPRDLQILFDFIPMMHREFYSKTVHAPQTRILFTQKKMTLNDHSSQTFFFYLATDSRSIISCLIKPHPFVFFLNLHESFPFTYLRRICFCNTSKSYNYTGKIVSIIFFKRIFPIRIYAFHLHVISGIKEAVGRSSYIFIGYTP